jgi:hypothetical protein
MIMTVEIERLRVEVARLRAALIDQAEMWEMLCKVSQELPSETFAVPFVNLHRPAERARAAAQAFDD